MAPCALSARVPSSFTRAECSSRDHGLMSMRSHCRGKGPYGLGDLDSSMFIVRGGRCPTNREWVVHLSERTRSHQLLIVAPQNGHGRFIIEATGAL